MLEVHIILHKTNLLVLFYPPNHDLDQLHVLRLKVFLRNLGHDVESCINIRLCM